MLVISSSSAGSGISNNGDRTFRDRHVKKLNLSVVDGNN